MFTMHSEVCVKNLSLEAIIEIERDLQLANLEIKHRITLFHADINSS